MGFFIKKLTEEQQRANSVKREIAYRETPEYIKQRIERLESMIDNPSCSVTDNVDWVGYTELTGLQIKLND